MKAKLFLALAMMEIRLENGVQFMSTEGESKEDFTARVSEVVDRDYVDTLDLSEVTAEDFKKFSLKQLQKMRSSKTGAELRIIQEILAERGALDEHPNSEGMIINPTQTVDDIPGPGEDPNGAKKEKAPKTEKAPKAEKAPKEEKAPRELKKQLSNDEALRLLDEATKNKGREVTFLCTKTKAEATGVIRGVRLDKRNNFIQYRIEVITPVEGGESLKEMFGKGIDSEDLKLGDFVPVPEKVEPAKEEKTEAKAEAKKEKKAKKGSSPAAEVPVAEGETASTEE